MANRISVLLAIAAAAMLAHSMSLGAEVTGKVDQASTHGQGLLALRRFW
jgi:hypothetical protein